MSILYNIILDSLTNLNNKRSSGSSKNQQMPDKHTTASTMDPAGVTSLTPIGLRKKGLVRGIMWQQPGRDRPLSEIPQNPQLDNMIIPVHEALPLINSLVSKFGKIYPHKKKIKTNYSLYSSTVTGVSVYRTHFFSIMTCQWWI